MSSAPNKALRRSGGVFLPVAAGLALLLLIGSLVAAFIAVQQNLRALGEQALERDMLGQPVQLEDYEPLPPEANPVPSGGGRFLVPSVGLDAPLGAVNVAGNRIEPPGFKSVYWVRNLGVPVAQAAQGTVFVATHSLRGGGKAPGNYLMDVRSGTTTLHPGTTIKINDLSYQFARSEIVSKAAISKHSRTWADTPGRLVILTCLQRPDNGRSVDVLVIEATLTSQAGTEGG